MHEKKLFLIIPPYDDIKVKYNFFPFFTDEMGPLPPLGLAYLKESIKKQNKGYEVSILDGQILHIKDIFYKIKKEKPEVVGISPLLRTFGSGLEIARIAKKNNAEVFMGGPHATGLAREIMLNRGINSSDYCVDAIVRESGELAFTKLLKNQKKENINNLMWCKDDKIIKNKIGKYKLPSLVNTKLDYLDIYFKEQEKPNPQNQYKRGMVVISRIGCRWRNTRGGCVFCEKINSSLHTKTPREFWEEIRYLKNYFNLDFIWDVSNDFLDDEKWLEEFALMRRSYADVKDIKFQFFCRIDAINVRTIKLLNKLYLPLFLIIGYDGGSDKTLKALNKGYNKKLALERTRLLAKLGSNVHVVASFILGAPGESKKTLEETVQFAVSLKKVGINISFTPHIFKPLPRSVAYSLMLRKYEEKYSGRDYVIMEELINDWVVGFCKTSLEKLVYTFRQLVSL
ncbi:MAG: B12-binding domain-containing radical SAM protein [Promethearchaeota archaeon]